MLLQDKSIEIVLFRLFHENAKKEHPVFAALQAA